MLIIYQTIIFECILSQMYTIHLFHIQWMKKKVSNIPIQSLPTRHLCTTRAVYHHLIKIKKASPCYCFFTTPFLCMHALQ